MGQSRPRRSRTRVSINRSSQRSDGADVDNERSYLWRGWARGVSTRTNIVFIDTVLLRFAVLFAGDDESRGFASTDPETRTRRRVPVINYDIV